MIITLDYEYFLSSLIILLKKYNEIFFSVKHLFLYKDTKASKIKLYDGAGSFMFTWFLLVTLLAR